MSKAKTPRAQKDNEAKAAASVIQASPQKVNLVAQMIRGLGAQPAVAALTFSKRRVANEVKKVLQAAIANAENNHSLDIDRLYVAEAHVVGAGGDPVDRLERAGGRVDSDVHAFRLVVALVERHQERRRRSLEFEIEAEFYVGFGR